MYEYFVENNDILIHVPLFTQYLEGEKVELYHSLTYLQVAEYNKKDWNTNADPVTGIGPVTILRD